MPDQTLSEQTHRGSCMCGAVQIEVIGKPLWTSTCHCADCRHATGAAMSAFVGYASDKARVTGESFAEYESSPDAFRGFCKRCGTRLTYRSRRWADELHIHTGVMENANDLAPVLNTYVKEKLDWVQMETGLPAFQTTPSEET